MGFFLFVVVGSGEKACCLVERAPRPLPSPPPPHAPPPPKKKNTHPQNTPKTTTALLQIVRAAVGN